MSDTAPEDLSEIGPVVAKLWRILAQKADAYAIECAAAAQFEEASKAAKYAEAFYWRSTGESDAIDLATDKLP